MKVIFLSENKTEIGNCQAEWGLSVYIEADGKKILFDTGASDMFYDTAKKRGVSLEEADLCVISHGHFDHTGAANELRRVLNLPVLAYRTANDYLLDARKNLSALCGPPITIRDATFIDDGDNITLEANPSFFLHVIYTPGHTTDSVTYYSSNDHVAFVGDTIFKGSIGNYQYPGGNLIDLQNSILNKIFSLPNETVLCSGHSAQTTVGLEKQRYR